MFQSYRWHRLSFARWMKGERYRLKGARLVSYSSGSFGGNKRQQLEELLEIVFHAGTGINAPQSMHVVKNPGDEKMSPRYRITDDHKVTTPDWIFCRNQLNSW